MKKITMLLMTALLIPGCGEDGKSRTDSSLYPDYYVPAGDTGGNNQCGPNTCSGCCQASGACITAVNDTNCGYGGYTCAPCQTGEKCSGGQCVKTTCDSTNCTGCCDSSKTCQNGTSDTICGKSGGSCTACTGNLVCLSGTCQTKGSGLYQVILVSITPVSSYDCDTFSKCDLYMELTVGSVKATSTVKADTDQPVWNEVLLTASESSIVQKFEARIWDDDWPFDQDLGYCKPTVTSKEIGAGTLTTNCGQYMSYGFLQTSVAVFKFKAI